MGVLFVCIGIAIFFGLDKDFEAFLLETGIFDITKVEQTLLEKVDI